MSHVAVLGLGAMGSRMALNLWKAGHAITVYSRNPSRSAALTAAGAARAASPRDAAERSTIVISMVTDNDASRKIWLDPESGALLGLHHQAIAVESSTLSIAWVSELAAVVSGRGAEFLDAPVVGSRPQADAAQLVYLVGGAKEAYAKAWTVLATMGSVIHHVGPVGQGSALKLAVNALFGIQVAALAETFGLMRRCGLPTERVAELLGGLPVMSPAAKAAADTMVRRNFAPLFPIDLVEKDFRYATMAAEQTGAEASLTRTAQAIFAKARSKGFGVDNISGIAQLFD